MSTPSFGLGWEFDNYYDLIQYNLYIYGGEYSCKKCEHAVANLMDMNTHNEDIHLGYQKL